MVAVQRFGATADGETRDFEVTSVVPYVDGLQTERWFHLNELDAFDELMSPLRDRDVRGTRSAWVPAPRPSAAQRHHLVQARLQPGHQPRRVGDRGRVEVDPDAARAVVRDAA